MIDQERVKKLLGSGLSTSVVAATVGCDDSYISQLLSDETFALAVAEIRTRDVVRFKEIDDKYDDLETKLLKKLEDLLPFFTKPRDVLAALHLVNSAKRKTVGLGDSDVKAGTVVNLTLPVTILNHYKVNMNGAMIEVGGRSLAPMPSSILMKTLEERRSHDEKPALLTVAPAANFPRTKIINENSI